MRASAATPEENLGVELGTVLVGKYRVDAIVGQGGMGVVARATHLHLQEAVAIKFLRADVVGDAEATERFMREMQAALKLKGEHVARVIDYGTTEGDIPYLVMEFLDGVDLDGMLEQSTRVAPPLAVDFVIQACEGLAEAHSQGIVHRDVKPSNVFVTWRSDGSPLVKLLDFGISKLTSSTDVSLTQTQSMLGTPAYMSPEQMRSARTVDQRSDIWSLGAVLFELCQGTRPFEADSFSEMCVKVAIDPPAPMTVAMPAGLEAVIGRCLEKKPDARFATVTEMAAALVPFARDPRLAAAAVTRIERLVGRGPVPAAIRDVKSAPIAMAPAPVPAGAGEYNPYPPKRTTPWASGGAIPAPHPPALAPGQGPATAAASAAAAAAWLTPPSSPSNPALQTLRSNPGLTGDTLDNTRRGPRTTGAIRTPRRLAVIALVAVLVVIAAMVGIAALGGGSTTPGPRPPSPAATPAAVPAAGASSRPDPVVAPAVVAPAVVAPAVVAPAVVAPAVVAPPASRPTGGAGKRGHGKRGHGKRGDGKRGTGQDDEVWGRRK